MNETKQQLMEEIKPILSKGKAINDIIFVSKKIGIADIAFMLLCLRCTKEQQTFKYRITHHKNNDYGWTDKCIIDFAENPVLTGGEDGLEQLVFGCLAALEVYTEEEICKVLDIQKRYRERY